LCEKRKTTVSLVVFLPLFPQLLGYVIANALVKTFSLGLIRVE